VAPKVEGSVGKGASRSKTLTTSDEGGVAKSLYRGLVYKGWEVEWYHPCERGITRSKVGPPTRLSQQFL